MPDARPDAGSAPRRRDIAFPEDDTMDVDVVDGGCNLEEGRLTLVRVDGR